jgi:formate dehydrogenase iron-sulfur subunit
LHLLRDLCDIMSNGSLCAMGSMTPIGAVGTESFPEDFEVKIRDKTEEFQHESAT